MLLVDTRRLTGPNLLGPRPLVVVELALSEGESVDRVRDAYASELGRMRAALGMDAAPPLTLRVRGRAVMIGYEAPLDAMFACAEMSEWAAWSAQALLEGRPSLPLEPKREEVRTLLAQHRNPRLLELASEAARRAVPFLWDDETVSVGHGSASRAFPTGAVPPSADVPWADLGAVPVALVTGTNGKTTTSRLLARLMQEAGWAVGASSSDALTLRGEELESGDCTGPFAARTILRHPGVGLAVLETARGGILRRGLAVQACEVAVLTNVGEDHLGSFGVEDVPAMAEVKGVVARAVRPGGTVVLHAADPNLVSLAPGLGRPVVFFADLDAASDATRALVKAHVEGLGRAIVCEGGRVTRLDGPDAVPLLDVAEIPITFGGAARHNVQNALGAAAAAWALGASDAAIVAGLRGFDAAQNPGRGEVRVLGGVTLLADFAHNPDGIRAVMGLVASLRARSTGRLAVITGSAGDRTDAEITGMARAIHAAGPDGIFVREMHDYLRGRAPGEVPELFERAFQALDASSSPGRSPTPCVRASTEIEALEQAFAWARPGDVVALLIHVDREGLRAFVARHARPDAPQPAA